MKQTISLLDDEDRQLNLKLQKIEIENKQTYNTYNNNTTNNTIINENKKTFLYLLISLFKLPFMIPYWIYYIIVKKTGLDIKLKEDRKYKEIQKRKLKTLNKLEKCYFNNEDNEIF